MARARTIDLGSGRSLHAVQAGRGRDLVLIHGAFATHRDWLTGPFDTLAGRFRVTAVDRPGHGLSLRPRFEGTPRDQAKQIRAGLDALGIDRATIVGHSLGGMVALAFAEQFPDTVDALVLLAPIAFPEARVLEHSLLAPRSVPLMGPFLSSLGEATIDRPLLDLAHEMMFWPQDVPPAWKADYPFDQILTPTAMIAEGEDSAAILPFAPAGTINLTRVTAPTHILAGTSDKIVDLSRHARPLAALLRNARLTELTAHGHMIHHSAQERVVEAIEQMAASTIPQPAHPE